MVLLAISLILRYVGGKFFFTFLDGWSILPWTMAVVAVIGGRPLLVWALPSIGFLFFMVPLPFRLEGQLSGPLQRIATELSTLTLQTLGRPAFAEGNVILLGDERLEVAQACSGLRLFMSVIALTYAYLAVIRRPWWEKGILVLACVPIAIASNATRIVATGLVYEITASASVRHWVHDSAGWAMIVFAAGLFGLLLWYLGRLLIEEEDADISLVVRRAQI
jgi:exosortase